MNLTFRPVTADDDDFLFELYATTREDIAAMGEPLMRMQFNAQRASYAMTHPNAEHSLVMVDAMPAGRLLISGGDRLMLINISLLPQFRSRGIGTRVINDLKERCRELLLHVATSNARARALYERLGFVRIGGDALYDEMRWVKVD
jgi:ribosomal protein S18 acetylase RimI-like enzyme